MQIINIARKELKDYFISPIAYIVIAIFLLLIGWFFFATFFLVGQASMRSFFSLLPAIFSFIIPAVTMRLFSEELNIGSYETLLTLPVTFNDIIIGKFLAGVLLPTLFYPLIIAGLGDLAWGPVIGGYLGSMLLGAAFTAIGIFASSLTRNQIIAFIVGTIICFGLTLLNTMLFLFPDPLLKAVAFFGATTHFENIAKGIIDSRDILYFASIVVVGLFGANLVMQNRGRYFKFIIYLIVIVLLNMVGSTLFFRIDLTRDGIYSLSPESKKVVSTLTEPLTIKAFFTKNLPAPHNTTEQYLRDLLEEYAVQGNTNFNYTIYDVSPQDTDTTGRGNKERELAESYGITPVQIQDIEKDEVKFKQAYMGLVILHGDMVEKIPTITSTDQLEYELTTSILKLNNKISALHRLKDKVKVTMFMSPALGPVGPLMGIRNLDKLPSTIAGIVKKIGARSYDRVEFTEINPTEGNSLEEVAQKNDLTMIKWPAIPEKQIASGEGAIGLMMEYHGKTKRLQILNVIKIPLLGNSYKLEDPNKIEEEIDKGMESLIGINSDIGYLSDHGTLATSPYSPTGSRSNDTIGTFASMVEKNYTLQEIALSKEPVPATLGTLIIARPTVKFSDYELYQIDQALMRGTNLIIYADTLKEEAPKGGPMMGIPGPQYVPIDTGLEKLLDHYGVKISTSYVFDENCYKQQNQGDGGETPLYFAPIIKNKNINKNVPFLRGIKGLITLLASPLELNQEQLKKNDITAIKLISSSENSWEMKDHITLNPMLIKPPQRSDQKRSFALAYLLEGKFTSYFEGKPLPEFKKDTKTAGETPPGGPEQKPESEVGTGATQPTVAGISTSGTFLSKGKKSKIFLMAASSMLRDNVIGPEGDSMNATFVMNGIDSFNGREGIATMRSKKQSFNPLVETPQPVKTFVKAFNIVGLPLLVALFGLFVWGLRSRKKQAIRRMFAKAGGHQ